VTRPLAALLLALLVALAAPAVAPLLHAQALPAPSETAAPHISAKAMAHIMARHGPESTAQGAGKYAKGTSEDTIRALVAEALRNAQPTPDTNFRPALLYDYRFAHVIGRTIDGAPTNRIRVVVSRRDGAVITAYPR
jgi:beta-lactamase class A